jgi:hypothetical protein
MNSDSLKASIFFAFSSASLSVFFFILSITSEGAIAMYFIGLLNLDITNPFFSKPSKIS